MVRPLAKRVNFRLSVFITAWLLLAGLRAAAQPPPNNPTPDPTQPNLFYGAVPPSGNQSPVLAFIPGLHGRPSDWWDNNDMYSMAYQAGYRTAFLGMSADPNQRNDAAIADNARSE